MILTISRFVSLHTCGDIRGEFPIFVKRSFEFALQTGPYLQVFIVADYRNEAEAGVEVYGWDAHSLGVEVGPLVSQLKHAVQDGT